MARDYEYIPLRDNKGHFFTADLGCAAALLSVGFTLVYLDEENPRRVEFVFERSAGIDEAVNRYFSDDLQVNARTLFDNIKALKSRIYND